MCKMCKKHYETRIEYILRYKQSSQTVEKNSTFSWLLTMSLTLTILNSIY